MPPIPYPNFVGGSYKSEFLEADCEDAINLYVEGEEVPGTKAPVILKGSPGLASINDSISGGPLVGGPIRGLLDIENQTSIVAGNLYYRLDNLNNLSVGTNIGFDGLPVPMTSNPQGVLIVSAGNAYVHNGAGVNLVASPPWTFPVDCAFMSGLFFILDSPGPDGGTIFFSAENDPTTWDPLDFTTSPSSDNTLKALGVTHNELWVFGTKVTQPFYFDASQTDTPIIPNQQAALEQGIINRDTRVDLDNTLFWLGQNINGEFQAFYADGYRPQRVSTHPIEREWLSYKNPFDCLAWAFQMDGHLFYHINFNTDKKSWRYDNATKLWHRVAYRNPITNLDEQHRGTCHCMRNGMHIVGDRVNPTLWNLSPALNTDGGDPIVALRQAPFPFQGNKRVFFPVFELITTPGAGNGVPNTPEFNPAWMLSWSNDNGHTFSPEFQLQMGQQGNYGLRQRKVGCGSGRNRVFRVTISANVPRCIIGAELPEGVTVGNE